MGVWARRQIVFLTILIILGMTIRYFTAAYDRVVASYEDDVTRTAYDIQLYLNGRQAALQTLATDPNILTTNFDLRQPKFLRFQQNFKFRDIVVFDYNGICLTSTDPAHTHYAADQLSLQQTLHGQITVTNRFSRRDDTLISIRVPIFNNDDVDGVLSAAITNYELSSLLQQATSANQYLFIVDGNAEYICHPHFDYLPALDDTTTKTLHRFLDSPSGSFISSANQDKTYKLYIYTSIGNTGWRLVLADSIINVYLAVLHDTADEILALLLALILLGALQRVARRTTQYQRGMELMRLERLSCVNQLAAGIAHEIRNPLTSIKGFIQLIARSPDSPASPHHLAIILEEINRIDQLINEFRQLAKPVQEPHYEQVDLVAMLKDINVLMEGQALNSNVKIALDAAPAQCLITGDTAQLKQVWLNLARNAIEAMPDGGTITITVTTSDAHVVINFTDTGTGIPANILPKLGAPFFTTKSGGTGLGLSVCFNIIHQHNGHIKITSKPGCGTTIAIELPLAVN